MLSIEHNLYWTHNIPSSANFGTYISLLDLHITAGYILYNFMWRIKLIFVQLNSLKE